MQAPFDEDSGDDADDGAGAAVTVTLGDNPPDRLDKALAAAVPEGAGLSRSRLMRLIAAGAVTCEGIAVTDPKRRPASGQVYTIDPGPAADLTALPEDIPLSVLHEDADLVVIDKPAGMVVHPAPGSPRGTLVNALLHRYGAGLAAGGGPWRPGIVHRIDKDTSGLLVVARTARAHQGLAAQFADHSVTRRYLAVLHGVPDPADPRLRGVRGAAWEAAGTLRIATGLARHRTDRQRQAVTFDGGRPAVTRVRVLEAFGTPPAACLAACWLETGRTHQIRVHLAHAGHGLVGDPVYGGSARRLPARALPEGAAAAAEGFPRQALHAASLGFTHPATGARLDFETPPPPDFAALLARLRGAG
jgi:23S rRNA pseudouridine1911/1915/1917 synthase